jgi:hypothetical protein
MLIVVLNVRFLLKWCEWEQKFISGIDPTIAWQDIITMVLRFGTSRSDTYGLSEKFETKLKTWINTPGQIVRYDTVDK